MGLNSPNSRRSPSRSDPVRRPWPENIPRGCEGPGPRLNPLPLAAQPWRVYVTDRPRDARGVNNEDGLTSSWPGTWSLRGVGRSLRRFPIYERDVLLLLAFVICTRFRSSSLGNSPRPVLPSQALVAVERLFPLRDDLAGLFVRCVETHPAYGVRRLVDCPASSFVKSPPGFLHATVPHVIGRSLEASRESRWT